MIEQFSGTMFGVYPVDGFPDDCLALFRFLEDAESFTACANCDVAIFPTEIAGRFTNADVGGDRVRIVSDWPAAAIDWPEEMRIRERLKFDQQFDGE